MNQSTVDMTCEHCEAFNEVSYSGLGVQSSGMVKCAVCAGELLLWKGTRDYNKAELKISPAKERILTRDEQHRATEFLFESARRRRKLLDTPEITNSPMLAAAQAEASAFERAAEFLMGCADNTGSA
ncbi:hypothetical protein DL239_12050 [Sedimentitalea sp. CY04]|uniref:Uncharacterized protein n=1 Tax=Parasedimentitalea denitrificans TaxID=2211118 RepID=A0ABX0W7W8_9RHOB|nr:hypothetical protein [Sedimentitalea sp. CY04]NIZ61702.1 hypothetical protein [Sedimentitalea sp. CY04]